MNKVAYYLILPFIYGVAFLPFSLLYVVSDFLRFVLFQGIGYRKKVVLENLKNAFPQKTEPEIQTIANKFYIYFCDLVVESLKTLTITSKDLKQHVSFQDLSLFERYYKQKQSIIVVMGHYGNWELCGARFALENLHQLFIIYHPLSNKYFNQLAYRMRTRLGNGLYSMQETLRGMIKNKDKCTATAFIADQSPAPETAYWTNFLSQDTPFFTGMAKIAKKMNYPVVYVRIRREKRGKYHVESELLIENPSTISENDITELYVKRLEKDITKQPEIWLWTHRRWKHKRNQSIHS
jgi:KDO2-lipid IV(A) lauroyltransferase